jgi:hypothetical protein
MHSPTQSIFVKPEDCPICYETVTDARLVTTTPLKYGHWAHNKCVKKWSLLYHKHILCPICKFKLKKSNIKFTNISSNKPIKKFEKDFIQHILFKLLPIPF